MSVVFDNIGVPSLVLLQGHWAPYRIIKVEMGEGLRHQYRFESVSGSKAATCLGNLDRQGFGLRPHYPGYVYVRGKVTGALELCGTGLV